MSSLASQIRSLVAPFSMSSEPDTSLAGIRGWLMNAIAAKDVDVRFAVRSGLISCIIFTVFNLRILLGR